ncbi:natural resistance-associated macrophage protein [Paraburkholderia phymatum STM815]|uniref:Natural resistance-associated macrophage protein n=2 Tax=Paraburkholderia phymatum TaxID=148447 RepID=B2JMU5_PARP8|nr:natural resistance-associated macrophage protein [Paraburkholderia phymatum STM815]
MGPGLASTASDNDPSGIAAYSLAGAQFGYDMLWLCVLSYPSMVAFQLIASRIAVLTGKGLTTNMREHYARIYFYLAVARFLIANVFNIAADTVAMGVAASLLWHGSVPVFAALGTAVSIVLQLTVRYPRYASLLKWLTLSLFAYAAVVIVLHVSWQTLVWNSLVPHVRWTDHYFSMLLAIIGTTISPYLLFSQATQQLEELRLDKQHERTAEYHRLLEQQFRKTRKDTLIRTALSNSAGLVIIAAAAATLYAHGHGLENIEDAARVLEPVARGYAAQVLALAFIGTALLALPPLAGSAAHSIASVLRSDDKQLENRRITRALLFVMMLGGTLGVALICAHVEPLRLLYWGAVVNGSTATPVMFMLVLLSTKRSAVGDLSAHWVLRCLCWLATAAAMAALVCLFVLERMR